MSEAYNTGIIQRKRQNSASVAGASGYDEFEIVPRVA
jgi:hypothetical protein